MRGRATASGEDGGAPLFNLVLIKRYEASQKCIRVSYSKDFYGLMFFFSMKTVPSPFIDMLGTRPKIHHS